MSGSDNRSWNYILCIRACCFRVTTMSRILLHVEGDKFLLGWSENWERIIFLLNFTFSSLSPLLQHCRKFLMQRRDWLTPFLNYILSFCLVYSPSTYPLKDELWAKIDNTDRYCLLAVKVCMVITVICGQCLKQINNAKTETWTMKGGH